MDSNYSGHHNAAILIDRERAGNPNPQYVLSYHLGNPNLGPTPLPNLQIKGRELKALKLYRRVNETALSALGCAVAMLNKHETVGDLEHILDSPQPA